MYTLDGGLFSEAFAAWVEGLREDEPDIVAIDGKTSRRARGGDRHPLHVVSAWASRQRLVLGQEATAEKSNEISAIPLLLERLHLTGALVTIDAIGTQTKIAETILARGADYLLAIKDNQRSLAEEVALFFDAPGQRSQAPFETTDADHGRIETRRHWVSHEVAWLNGDRRAPGEPRFPGLKAIAMVEAEVEREGKTTLARRFFLSSLPLDAALLARAVRAHWGIENRLHWVLDVVFHDDLMRLRTGNGPRNMATIKHMAMNLIRGAGGKDSLKVRRKTAAWDQEYLKALITRTAQ
jgi:predicted transposase YbfD/YdcC